MEDRAPEPSGDATPPWLRHDTLRPVPPGKAGRYGYLRADGEGTIFSVVRDVETLGHRAGRAQPHSPLLVWTPTDRHLRTIYEVEEIAGAVEERGRAEAQAAARRALPKVLVAVLLLTAGIVFWPEKRELQLLLLLGTIFLFAPLWTRGVTAYLDARRDLRALRRDRAGWRRRRAERLRFLAWNSAGSSRTGPALGAVAAGVFVLTLIVGREPTFTALALVKARVADGELWRLFTCTLLHANLLHIYFNVIAGLALAGTARRLVSESRVLLTFLVSALAGSAASVLLSNATSVGASGGILGWGGMLAGLGLAHPDVRRTGIMSNMLRWVFLLALIGVVGAGFIDNGAHAGGFAAGFGLGLLFGRRGRRAPLPIGGDRLGPDFWVLAALGGAGALGTIAAQLRMALA